MRKCELHISRIITACWGLLECFYSLSHYSRRHDRGKELNAACHEATKELAYPAVLFAISLLYIIICAVSDVIKHM